MIYESFPHTLVLVIFSPWHTHTDFWVSRAIGACWFLLTLELQPLIEIPGTSQCCCQSPQQPEGRRHGKRERKIERERDMETRSSIRDAECKKRTNWLIDFIACIYKNDSRETMQPSLSILIDIHSLHLLPPSLHPPCCQPILACWTQLWVTDAFIEPNQINSLQNRPSI